MTPHDYIRAARVPDTLEPQEFGLWTIDRRGPWPDLRPELRAFFKLQCGFESQTLLYHQTLAKMMDPPGEIVMEDSIVELRKHLPIWLAAHGRVLITGLGLGCVVRGLLAKPSVEHVDVVEIDAQIIRVIGAEFAGNPRVTIHHADALKWLPDGKFDFAWHDLWLDDKASELHLAHGRLIVAAKERVGKQGAWEFPRVIKRLNPELLG